MFRYVVLIWNHADPRAAQATARLRARLQGESPSWLPAFETQGLVGLHAGAQRGANEASLFERHAGVVFGKLFSRSLEDSFPPVSTPVACDTKSLFERYWGRYVAVIRDANTATVRIVRDPSGALPCFFTRHEGVHLVFSDLADVLPLGLEFSVNWNYIRTFMAYSGFQSWQTGLNEVGELQPGECAAIRGEAVERSLEWNPVEIAHAEPLEDPHAGTELVRQTLRACVHAWAAGYPAILHRLSGGLDSSVVASCLSDAPLRPKVICLNMFSHGRQEDERYYARLVAERCNLPLVEREVCTDFRLERILEVLPAAKPWSYVYDLQHSPLEIELAAQRGLGATFSGAGGDSVFYQGRADLAVTDYLLQRGMRPAVFGVALDAAHITRKSLWPLLRSGLRNRFKPRPWHPLSAVADVGIERTLIAQSVLQTAGGDETLAHPFLRAANRMPPGKAWHIHSVMASSAFYNCFQRDGVPDQITPLMSQPLVELCLRIPTYVWIDGGRDRSLVRSGFERDLPREIVRRRVKGMADRSIRDFLDANLPFVREMLLDGWMVREGLLDRARLELYLSREKSPADAEYNEILQHHLSTEAWLRSWKPLERRAG